MPRTLLASLALLLALLLVAACAPSPTPDQTPVPTPGPAPVFGETATHLLQAVNQERRVGATCGPERFPAAAPLTLEARLVRAADAHTTDMVRNGFFSHTGADGSSVGQRVTRQGYAWRAVGENIAYGQRSVEQVVSAWMASPGHCRAIMSGEFQELGAARVENHWTLVFGTPR